jgi:hypothetical protein
MDLILQETGNGGDVILNNNYDINMSDSFYTAIYLSLFGGNTEASTSSDNIQPEQRFDFWGNNFFDIDSQFNSFTERAINNNALDTKGIKTIETAVRKDVSWLSAIGTVKATCNLITLDQLQILITLQQGNTTNPTTYEYIWDATKQEVIINKNIK